MRDWEKEPERDVSAVAVRVLEEEREVEAEISFVVVGVSDSAMTIKLFTNA